MLVQFDLFESHEQSEIKAMNKKIDEMDKSLHKCRKALFARNSELAKKCVEYDKLIERIEIIERNICKK